MFRARITVNSLPPLHRWWAISSGADNAASLNRLTTPGTLFPWIFRAGPACKNRATVIRPFACFPCSVCWKKLGRREGMFSASDQYHTPLGFFSPPAPLLAAPFHPFQRNRDEIAVHFAVEFTREFPANSPRGSPRNFPIVRRYYSKLGVLEDTVNSLNEPIVLQLSRSWPRSIRNVQVSRTVLCASKLRHRCNFRAFTIVRSDVFFPFLRDEISFSRRTIVHAYFNTHDNDSCDSSLRFRFDKFPRKDAPRV